MCTQSCIDFGIRNVCRADIEGKRVLELGSYIVNGSLRDIILKFGPKEYIGVDIVPGPGVDVVCGAGCGCGLRGRQCC
jgi:hypothetical protein